MNTKIICVGLIAILFLSEIVDMTSADTDALLEPGEKVKIQISLPHDLSGGDWFQIEIKPSAGAVLSIRKTIPGTISSVMVLYLLLYPLMLYTPKAVVHTGVEQATSSVELAGDIIGRDVDNNGKIESITLYIQLTAGENPVNMDEVTISYADEEVDVRLTPMGNKPLKRRGQWNWSYLTQPRVVHTGVEQATSSCELVGDVICSDTNSNSLIDRVSFNIQLTAGQKPVNLDKAVIAFATGTIYNPSVIWTYTVYEGDSDNLLEPGEKAEIEVTLPQELGTYNEFTLEFKSEAGVTLTIERTTPVVIKPVVTPAAVVVIPPAIPKPVATPRPTPTPILPVATPPPVLPISPEYFYIIPIALFLILLPLIFYARGKRKKPAETSEKSSPPSLEQKVKEEQISPPISESTTIERAIYDPCKRDFIEGQLPRMKEWINRYDPGAYWFVISIQNNTDKAIEEWGVELETSAALKIEEAKIEGIEIEIPHEAHLGLFKISVPKEYGIVIPKGGAQRVYFKLRAEKPKTVYEISGVFKSAIGEVPIRTKEFKYLCDVGALPEAVKVELKKVFSEKDAARLALSFKIVQEIDRMCNTGAKTEEYLDRLSVLRNYTEGFSDKFTTQVDEFSRFMKQEQLEYLDEEYKVRVRRFCTNLVDVWISEFLKG